MLLWCFHLSGDLVSKADIWMWRVDSGFSENLTRDEGHLWLCVRLTFICDHGRLLDKQPSAFPGTHLLWLDFFFCVPVWPPAYQRNTHIFLCLLMLTIVYAAIPFVFIQNCQPSVFPACSVNTYKSSIAGLREPTRSSSAVRMWR